MSLSISESLTQPLILQNSDSVFITFVKPETVGILIEWRLIHLPSVNWQNWWREATDREWRRSQRWCKRGFRALCCGKEDYNVENMLDKKERGLKNTSFTFFFFLMHKALEQRFRCRKCKPACKTFGVLGCCLCTASRMKQVCYTYI